MKRIVLTAAAALSLAAASAAETAAPLPPGRESWTFMKDLATPVIRHPRERFRLADEYGLKGDLATALDDLAPFLGGERELKLVRGGVDGQESYRIDVTEKRVTLTAGDDDGMRRAVYRFEDGVLGGCLTSETRKPWLRNRISRCFFGPIKRPPYNRDELLDDIDYYPDAYLNRLAHEGVNGLWLTVHFRDLAATPFTERAPDAEKRLDKLRRTVAKCRRYGIKTWIFGNEPSAMRPDDPLLKAHPEFGGSRFDWTDRVTFCPSEPGVLKYLEETMKDIFTQVPGLGGFINISNGEGLTTCLSAVPCSDVTWTPKLCPRCAKRRPWELHYAAAGAMAKGMRAAASGAEILSWFYQPEISAERKQWVYEAARHLPEGVTLLYNFESGALKKQAGRWRVGGDYWLSFPGPAAPFARVAENARGAGLQIGAKIQTSCSHEVATVPYVPAPGLLWRKYKGMKEAGVTSAMMCWYFGNYPGLMNKAAGELAFDDFTGGEEKFLMRLAAPDWGTDAPTIASLWRTFTGAYENYPLSNNIQYFGPFAAGVAWPLRPDVRLDPLPASWIPIPSEPWGGDAIGECLPDFSLDEALLLARRMAEGTSGKDADGRDVLAELSANYAGDRERSLDLGVMKALHLQFAAGADVFAFYRLRSEAVYRSRVAKDAAAARVAVAEMKEVVLRERALTEEMDALAKTDSRLGFHSEAEAHLYHPALLKWRLGELGAGLKRLGEIDSALAAGGAYPLSAFEKAAAVGTVGGGLNEGDGIRWRAEKTAAGDLAVTCECAPGLGHAVVSVCDASGVSYPTRVFIPKTGDAKFFPSDAGTVTKTETGWMFRLVFDAGAWRRDDRLRPAWIAFLDDTQPQQTYAKVLWPNEGKKLRNRLNLNWVHGDLFGRLVW